MPRQPEPKSYEDRLVASVADEITGEADTLAAEYGLPPDSASPSERRKVQLWGQADPKASYEALFEMLMTTGVPPEVMATMQISRYARSHPALVQAFAAPIEDPALADRLARIAEHPFRVALYDQFDPKDRVREAERIDREWRKGQGGTVVEEDEGEAY